MKPNDELFPVPATEPPLTFPSKHRPTEVRRSFSQDEIVAEARRWLASNYSMCKLKHPDKYFDRLGLLMDFVTDIVPKEQHD